MPDPRSILDVVVPWPSRLLSPNGRAHWSTKRRAQQRFHDACYVLALQARPRPVPDDVAPRVAMTFCPPVERQRDQDNLIASMKHGLDGLAKALRINDSRFRLDEPAHGAIVKGGEVRVRVYAESCS